MMTPRKMQQTAAAAVLLWMAGCMNAEAQLRINELMQSNIDCLMDNMREFPDSWVELYNSSDAAVKLDGWALATTPAPGEAWPLPQGSMTARQHMVIYCDRVGSGSHAPFRLESGKGGAVYLFKDGSLQDSVVALPKQPAPNIAWGRKTEGSDEWGYQAVPTPRAANCGQLLTEILPEPVFSRAGHVVAGSTTVSLELSLPAGVPAGTEIRYTLDGSEPTAASRLYEGAISFDTTTVVRAKLVCQGYLSPRSTTHSYILHGREQTLPVVSLVTDDDYFFGERNGILQGGDIKWTPSGNLVFPNYYYTWRRPVNVEYFPVDSPTSVVNQLGETRLMGQSSRVYSLKSMVIYANKRFSKKNFKYEFFPDQKPGRDKFKSLCLRNAGNDFTSLYMRDAIIQRTMASHADIDWQAWQPAIVYLNGRYYGMLNLRERSNAANIATNYGSNVADSIDMVEYWGNEVKEGDPLHWEAFKKFYTKKGHTIEEYAAQMDLKEVSSIMAMNFFFNNYDFPGNNCVWWRPTHEGGRWRIIAKDCDFGMGLNGIDYNFPILEWFYNPGYALQNGISLNAQGSNEWQFTEQFRNMMDNADYRNYFSDMMAIYMGDFLNGHGTRAVWDPMASMIEQEWPYHQAAIENWWDRSDYPSALSFAQQWVEKRTGFMYEHLSDFYKLGKPIPVAVNNALDDDVCQELNITLNDIRLSHGRFDGQLFARHSITLSSQPTSEAGVADRAEGSAIIGWTVETTDANGKTTTATVSTADYIFTVPTAGSLRINPIFDVSSIMAADRPADGRLQGRHGPSGTYDLQGRRVAGGQVSTANGQLKKGLYIVGGKKVVR